MRRMRFEHWRKKALAGALFALAFGFALSIGGFMQPAVAGKAKMRAKVYSTTHGWLWAGQIVRGEPDLPIGWRAYPVSMFDDVYVVQPDRRRYRVNFKSRFRTRPRR